MYNKYNKYITSIHTSKQSSFYDELPLFNSTESTGYMSLRSKLLNRGRAQRKIHKQRLVRGVAKGKCKA